MADFWFKFEWDAWLGDTDLSRCSLETQGLWIRCIALMHKMGVCKITGTVDEVRRLLGVLPEELVRSAEELRRTDTADVEIRHNIVTLKSRRLERVENKRVSANIRKQKSRSHNDVTEQSLEYRVKSIEESTNVDSKEGEKEPTASDFAPPTPNPAYHPALKAIVKLCGHMPAQILWTTMIETLGDDPDIPKLTRSYREWTLKGYKPKNYGWVTDWYANGIPDEFCSNQRSSAKVAAQIGKSQPQIAESVKTYVAVCSACEDSGTVDQYPNDPSFHSDRYVECTACHGAYKTRYSEYLQQTF